MTEIAWVLIHTSQERLAGKDFSGIPVVIRGTEISCPPEYIQQVEEILRVNAPPEMARTHTVDGLRTSPIVPDGAFSPIQTQAAPNYDGLDAPSTIIIEEPVSQDPSKLASVRSVAAKVEGIEVSAFNMMEHRDKVLGVEGDNLVESFSILLSDGFRKRLKRYTDSIASARTNIQSNMKSLLSIVSENKASDFYKTALAKIMIDLDSSTTDMGKEIIAVKNRLGAFGIVKTTEEVKNSIVTKLRNRFEDTSYSRSSTNLDSKINAIVEAEIELTAAIRGLKLEKAGKEGLKAEAKKYLSEIAGLAFVTKVGVVEDTLFVETEDVQILYKYYETRERTAVKKKKISLGKFKIGVRFGLNPKISLVNIGVGAVSGREGFRAKGGYYHPHVTGGPNQSICWGNVRGSVYKLIGSWDFVTFFTLVWSFLNTYNTKDSYVKLKRLGVLWDLKLPGHDEKL